MQITPTRLSSFSFHSVAGLLLEMNDLDESENAQVERRREIQRIVDQSDSDYCSGSAQHDDAWSSMSRMSVDNEDARAIIGECLPEFLNARDENCDYDSRAASVQ
jgi:hypothetical protein